MDQTDQPPSIQVGLQTPARFTTHHSTQPESLLTTLPRSCITNRWIQTPGSFQLLQLVWLPALSSDGFLTFLFHSWCLLQLYLQEWSRLILVIPLLTRRSLGNRSTFWSHITFTKSGGCLLLCILWARGLNTYCMCWLWLSDDLLCTDALRPWTSLKMPSFPLF